MHSVRRRLSFILIVCTIATAILYLLFVNIAMDSTFNKYMKDVQDERNASIVEYFQQVYKKDGRWTQTSGEELIHEAYMSNYSLTLLDKDKKMIWGMNPSDIMGTANMHRMMGSGAGKGVYTSKTFKIDVDGKTVGYAVIGQYYPVLLSGQDINFKNSINKGIAASALIAVFIVAFVSLAISKQFSLPIKRVSDTSVELSKGNYESGSDIKSNIREINNLLLSINTLGEKLKNQDSLRKRLVSDISHELRTPLHILQNNLEAMIDGILPVTKDRLNNLNDEVIRFGKLLNNLNSLKQFEVEDVHLNMDTVFLSELVPEVCEDFRALAKEKDIKIYYKSEPGKYMIIGDEDKLRQVFINLLSNAVKFNKVDGSIWVELSEDNTKINIKIKDNGIGIKKEDLPFIFERLYRGDKSRHETPGSGIGLTLTKDILNLHSADIDVKSQVDKETTVTVSFSKI